jgi:hypothetical protein
LTDRERLGKIPDEIAPLSEVNNMRTTRLAFVMCSALVLATLSLLGGCAGTSVYTDPNPEMATMGYTSAQHRAELSRTVNYDFRQMWDDWDNFWLVDEPIRLTNWPIP